MTDEFPGHESQQPASQPLPSSGQPDLSAARQRQAAMARRAADRGRSPYFSAMLAMLFILITLLIVPPFLERVSYYMARGESRAAREELQQANPIPFSLTSRQVAKAVEDSVVFINTQSNVAGGALFPGVDRLAAGQGSGVIIDNDGHILTNFHVVAGANRITVYPRPGRGVPANVVGFDEYTDLAVLKIDVDGLVPIEWGDSESLEAGDPVWAVGSPFGLENSISFGIVSAKGRAGIGETRYQDFLQTDAAVNPGNSGGALVDSNGRLVGINTAIVGQSFRGISFAIPSKMARDVFTRLIEEGIYDRGWLGVQLDRVTPARAEQLGLPNEDGAIVMAIVTGSPASRADVRAGDVIVSWNGEKVEGPSGLSKLVASTKPDSTVEMVVIRDGVQQVLEVSVGSLPRNLRRGG